MTKKHVRRDPFDGLEIPTDLAFMLRKISVSEPIMAYWLNVPEFVEEIRRRIRCNESIDDRCVLLVMKEVYDDIEFDANHGHEIDFAFRLARRGINQLTRVVDHGDSEVLN